MAVMSGHIESAERVLAEMLPGELSRLTEHAMRLSEMALSEWHRKRSDRGTAPKPCRSCAGRGEVYFADSGAASECSDCGGEGR